MAPEIINNLDKIIDSCKKMQVKSLYVVGSASRTSDYTKDSDIDFLYQMITDDEGYNKSGFDYFDLLFSLQEITGKKVDLIAEKGIRNKYFLRSLAEDKQKIYEA
jgi:predicted nucleotidyltransferase